MPRKRTARSRPPRPQAAPPTRPARSSTRDRTLVGAVGVVLLALLAVIDDRHAGLIADGRQMIRTAVALVETGEIGQAVGQDFTYERGGEGVSRFGMATSLLQIPAAYLAPGVERRVGPGGSQALFLVVPWLAVGIAGLAAGALTRRLGGSDLQVVAAVLLATIASPLGSYAALEFSEPVQAAALTVALACALAASQAAPGSPRLELAAGAAAGFAVLAKSSLILAAPLTLLPLLEVREPARTRRAVVRAGLGAAAPLALWIAFEFARFGRLFGGYPDDRFTHPWFEGMWRLLIGPNRGFLLFWPAMGLVLWTGVRLRHILLASPVGRAWTAAMLVFVAQLAVAAGYWGWHGMEGWGARLILSAVPLLAPFAAVAALPRYGLATVVAASLLINLPPLLQHPTPVATYVMNLRWPEVDASEAPRYPFYATAQTEGGATTVIPFERLEQLAVANPWQLYLWLWRASHLDDAVLAKRLRTPPWIEVAPELVPPTGWSPAVARHVVPPPRYGFLGRSLTGTGGPYATVYLDALLDQVIRANQQGLIDRALELSARRLARRQDGEAAAWRLETLRRAGRAGEAEALLRSLPESVRAHPLINVVLALFDREFGEERRARALLDSVASAFPNTPVQRALETSMTDWPTTLDALTRSPRRDAIVGRER